MSGCPEEISGRIGKKEIIERLAKGHVVEDIIRNFNSGEQPANLQDLAQEIYISLLEKDEALICSMNAKDELRFFISRMVSNNIFSKNSPYYKTFKKNQFEELKYDNGEIDEY